MQHKYCMVLSSTTLIMYVFFLFYSIFLFSFIFIQFFYFYYIFFLTFDIYFQFFGSFLIFFPTMISEDKHGGGRATDWTRYDQSNHQLFTPVPHR